MDKLFVLLLLFNYFLIIRCLQCVDENNEPVDWLVIYKFPKIKHDNSLIESGLGYAFITSNNYESWKFSQISIKDKKSALGRILQPLYNKTKENLSYILYDDQPPNGYSNPKKGHTKGVVMTNSSNGLWLIHSIPHFPPLTQDYDFPSTGVRNGQSILCLSLDSKNLNEVGIQLQYNEPQIFDQIFPEKFKSLLPELWKAANNITVQNPPWYRQTVIVTKQNIQFTSFAKSGRFNKELYQDWVAPALNSDLLVETWLNGDGRLSSNCSKSFKVYNIETIKIADVSFNSTHDHSKWAVANKWICIGDINRMEHQRDRGGGTVCLKNKQLVADYRNTVAAIEKCTKSYK